MSNQSGYQWVTKFRDHFFSKGIISDQCVMQSDYIFLFDSSANMVLDYFLKKLNGSDIYISVDSDRMSIFKNDSRPENHLRVLRKFKIQLPTALNPSGYKLQRILENTNRLGFLGPACDEITSTSSNSIANSLKEVGITFKHNMPRNITLVGKYEMLSAFTKLLPKNILERVRLQIFTDFMDSSCNKIELLISK